MKLVKQLLATGALLGAAVVAQATPATWVDSIDFNPDVYVSQWTSFSYQHDITDNGFVVGTDSVSSYSLNVNLFDDDKKDGLEIALLDLPGWDGDRFFFDLSGQEFGGWSFEGSAQLTSTGKLNVTVDSWLGDFFIGDSTLTAKGNKGNSVSAPEPGTLALMGLGLLGVAGLSRRKKSA